MFLLCVAACRRCCCTPSLHLLFLSLCLSFTQRSPPAQARAAVAYLVEPSLDATLPVLVEVAIGDDVVVLDHFGSTAHTPHEQRTVRENPPSHALTRALTRRSSEPARSPSLSHTHIPSRKVSPKVAVNLELGRLATWRGSKSNSAAELVVPQRQGEPVLLMIRLDYAPLDLHPPPWGLDYFKFRI